MGLDQLLTLSRLVLFQMSRGRAWSLFWMQVLCHSCHLWENDLGSLQHLESYLLVSFSNWSPEAGVSLQTLLWKWLLYRSVHRNSEVLGAARGVEAVQITKHNRALEAELNKFPWPHSFDLCWLQRSWDAQLLHLGRVCISHWIWSWHSLKVLGFPWVPVWWEARLMESSALVSRL